jgi:hypothetical protein
MKATAGESGHKITAARKADTRRQKVCFLARVINMPTPGNGMMIQVRGYEVTS